jgi:anti-anti-sigma regulatory factor
MGPQDQGASLVVIRSEAESGQFALRLIGELDLSTIAVLDAQLGEPREQSLPSVIDISELRFLDLTGLRALQRCGHGVGSLDPLLVGATGIVLRVIELVSMLDAERTAALVSLSTREPARRIAAENGETVVSSGRSSVALGAAGSTPSTAPVPVPAAR